MGTNAQTVRVAFIESQLLFARALGQVLSSDATIVVTGVFRSLDELSQNVLASAELLLVDIDEYSSDVATTLTVCRRYFAGAHICALSSFARPDLMQRCLAAGADGFIIKDTSIGELTFAIKLLATGSPYVDARVAGGALRRHAINKEISFDELSHRETEIVRLIAQGRSNREIGTHLALSEKNRQKPHEPDLPETANPGAHRRSRLRRPQRPRVDACTELHTVITKTVPKPSQASNRHCQKPLLRQRPRRTESWPRGVLEFG